MTTNPNPVSLKEEAAHRLSGSRRSDALGPTIRLLVWNTLEDKSSTCKEGLTELCANQDLVLNQQRKRCDVSATEAGVLTDEQYKWITADTRRSLQADVLVGVNTGCVVSAQQHELHNFSQDQHAADAQFILLETHYALVASDKTLMVLNLFATSEERGHDQLPELEQLKQTLERHSGAILVAGEFDAWSSTMLAHFQQYMSEANLFEASMTRRENDAQVNTRLDHVFFRGLSLRSVESLPNNLSTVYSSITATFVVE